VNFKNTIIIMTSNLGSHVISELIAKDFGGNGAWEAAFDDLKQELFALLRQTIRPEFLNRVDEVIIFKPLGHADIRKIVTLQLTRVSAMLAKQGLHLEMTEEASDWLAKLRYEPIFGARPLKRVIQRYVVNPLSERILEGEFVSGDTVEVSLDSHGLIALTKGAGGSPRP
jgi:ATP-dependent Clp protease ATP-binding subunit ClpB